MNLLEVNDWILINAITYKIHGIEDMDEMALAIMEQMKFLFDFDSSSFYRVLGKDSREIGHPVGIQYSAKDMEEYLKVFKEVDYSKGLMSTGKNIAYRESDIINDEIRIQTEYYKKVYDKQKWHFSLHLNICYKEIFLGVMSFFRVKGKPDFDYGPIFILDMIKDHLALRIYNEVYQKSEERISIKECGEVYGLTLREQELLEMMISGIEDEKICSRLCITENTFKKHVLNLYKKVGVNKRVQLIRKIRA